MDHHEDQALNGEDEVTEMVVDVVEVSGPSNAELDGIAVLLVVWKL